MTVKRAALLLSLLAHFANGQLPNARVGLHPSGDGPDLATQSGYPIIDRDIPFAERYEMKMVYYNVSRQPLFYKDKSPFDVACCYPANAFWTSNVALHPYWFRTFGLDRWCRQDVCLSIWLPDRSHDLMYKITDVCDPKDCPDPLTIKVEPFKGRYLYFQQPNDNPTFYPTGPVHAYFVKCWADSMVQPDLEYTVPGPKYLNSRPFMIRDTAAQWAKNQAWNQRNGKPIIPIGSLWRPEATQKWVQDYNPDNFPVGSSKKVKARYPCDNQRKG